MLIVRRVDLMLTMHQGSLLNKKEGGSKEMIVQGRWYTSNLQNTEKLDTRS